MKSRRAPKRLEYFDRGCAAYERVTGVAGVYLCPLCGDAFTQDDVESDRLTLEDVPPKSVGGRPMCLTCRPCNSAGGHQVDATVAELARMGRLHDAANRRGTPFSARAHVPTLAGRVNARLSYDKNGVRSLKAYRSENDPRILESAATVTSVRVSVPFRVSERVAFVSFLRAGYLAAFSFGGYSFALDGRLDAVRRQIATPDADIIPQSAMMIVPRDAVPSNAPFVGKSIRPILATAVCLTIAPRAYRGAIMVMLPPLADGDDFYDRLTPLYPPGEGRRRQETEVVAWGWPTGPEHQWDYPIPEDLGQPR